MRLSSFFLSLFSLTSASLISQKIDVNYDKREGPQDFTATVLNVTLRLEDLSLIRVNDDRTIAWMLSYKMSWHDDRLRFSPKTWSGQSRFFMPASHLWLPRIAMGNALTHRRVGSETTQDATVHSDGRITMRSKFYVETACGMNLINFPFDVHDCPLVFVSSSLPTSFLDIHPQIRLHRKDETFGEFALEEVNLEENNVQRGRDEFKEIRFVAHLSRHSSSITVSIIIPVSLLVGVLLALHHARAFQGDDQSVDKSTLITSTFLVFFLHSGLLVFFVPRGSTVASLASLLLGQLSLILFSFIFSMASANRLSRKPCKSGPPGCLYRLACLRQPHQLLRLRLEETEKIVEMSSPSDTSNGTTSAHNRACSEKRRERLREEEWRKVHHRLSLIVLILLECFNLFMVILYFYVSTRPTPARINYN